MLINWLIFSILCYLTENLVSVGSMYSLKNLAIWHQLLKGSKKKKENHSFHTMKPPFPNCISCFTSGADLLCPFNRKPALPWHLSCSRSLLPVIGNNWKNLWAGTLLTHFTDICWRYLQLFSKPGRTTTCQSVPVFDLNALIMFTCNCASYSGCYQFPIVTSSPVLCCYLLFDTCNCTSLFTLLLLASFLVCFHSCNDLYAPITWPR